MSKRIGPNKQPRGTPWVILRWGDIRFEMQTNYSLLVIWDSNHWRALPLIMMEDRLWWRILWSRISKGDDIASRVRIVPWVLLSLNSKFNEIRVSDVSVNFVVSRRFERYSVFYWKSYSQLIVWLRLMRGFLSELICWRWDGNWQQRGNWN